MNAFDSSLIKIRVTTSFISVLTFFLLVGCISNPKTPTIPASNISQPQTNAITGSLPPKLIPLSAYDRAMTNLISSNWEKIVASPVYRKFERYQPDTGNVVITYQLNKDGSISKMKVISSNMNRLYEFACEKAIKQSAPFSEWPPDMVKRMGEKNYRKITFTFTYYKDNPGKK